MTPAEMRERLLVFSIDVLAATRALSNDSATRHVSQQLFRAATSVACNYRAATLARSRTEFIAKLGIVREEADEVVFWLELMTRAAMWPADGLRSDQLVRESAEIAAIVSAAYRTSRERYGKWKP